ncbi:MAG: hypothetical protein ACE5GA_00155 [Candidatus Zixiibacteriota bacterium]
MIYDCTAAPNLIDLIYFDSEPDSGDANKGTPKANESGSDAPGKPAGAEGGEGSKGEPKPGEDQAKLAEAKRLAEENATLLKQVEGFQEKVSFLTKRLGNLGGQKGAADELAKLKNDPEYVKKFLGQHHSKGADGKDPFNAEDVLKTIGESGESEKLAQMLAGISGQLNTVLRAQGGELNQAGQRLSQVENVLSEARLAEMFAPELQAKLDPIVERNKALVASGALPDTAYHYMAAMQELLPDMLATAKAAGAQEKLDEIGEKTRNQVLLGRTYATGRKVDPEKEVSAKTAISRLSKVRS